MRRTINSFVVLCLMVSIILSNFGTTQAKSKIKLSSTKITMNISSSKIIKVKGISKKQKVKWYSSNKKVATVSTKGKIIAKNAGKSTISTKISGKKLKCNVFVIEKIEATPTPLPTPTPVGSIKGNVTWQYNKYIGTKPDTGAYVALIPIGKDLVGINHERFSMRFECDGSDGIYSIKADGYGVYQFDNIPIGNYTILIVSKQTTSGTRFNDETFWNERINSIVPFLSNEELEKFKVFVGYNSFITNTITINENQITTFSHDFGNTYM